MAMMNVTRERRVAIVPTAAEPWIAENQRAALHRYAKAMGWTVAIDVKRDMSALLEAINAQTLDIVLCWRTSELIDADALFNALHGHDTEFLALAQSCAALAE